MFQPTGSCKGVFCCISPCDLVCLVPPHHGGHFLLNKAELGDPLWCVQDEQEPDKQKPGP